MSEDVFMGKNGFFWFFGTVEDNGDPLGLGRCRVRIAGWHHQSPDVLPTEVIPWAYPVTPITNAAVGGVGVSPIGPQPGTRVFGFFMDGETGQQPVMLGTVPGGSEVVYRRKIEAGSTEWLPSVDNLLYGNSTRQEDDSPVGYDVDNKAVNKRVPNPAELDFNSGDWVLPCTGFVSSAYGERGGRHNGVDICPAGFYEQTDAGAAHLNGRLRGPVGNPVFAAAAGVVEYVWKSNIGQRGVSTRYDALGPPESRSYGNAVAIRHTLSSGTYISIYAHLGTSQDAAQDTPGAGINVSVGQSVSTGQQIGTMGRSHCRDSLTHLHFEIRVGESLPKASNHINPGRVFPQLAHRHGFARSWADSQVNYAVKDLPFELAEAPVIALDHPQG